MQEVTLEISNPSSMQDPSKITNSSSEVALYFQEMIGIHFNFFTVHQDKIIKNLCLKVHFIGKAIVDFNIQMSQFYLQQNPKVLCTKYIKTVKESSDFENIVDIDNVEKEDANFQYKCSIKFIPRNKELFTAFTTDILRSFVRIRRDQKFFDFTLKFLNEKEIRVHRFILASKSLMFSRMFKSNLQECQSNEAVIIDVDYEVMKHLVSFMYGEKIDDFGIYLFDVLIAADKYQILDLKQFCEMKIAKCMSFDTIADVLISADFYNAEFLKEKCIEYIHSNWETLKDIQKFEKIFKYPELILDIFKTFNISDFPIRSIISNL